MHNPRPAAESPARPAHDWIGIAPPLVTTKQDADEIIAIIEQSVFEVVTA